MARPRSALYWSRRWHRFRDTAQRCQSNPDNEDLTGAKGSLGSGCGNGRDRCTNAACSPAGVLLRAFQVCQHFFAGYGLAFHWNGCTEAMVLPRAVLLGLVHLGEDLFARLARLSMFWMGGVTHLGRRRMDDATRHRGRCKGYERKSGEDGTDCHEISPWLESTCPVDRANRWTLYIARVTVC